MLSIETLIASGQFVGGLSAGTLLTQLCKYMGGARPDLVVAPFYVGLLFSSFVVMGRENKLKVKKKGDVHPSLHSKQLLFIACLAVIRLSGTVFSIFAIDNCGSATVSPLLLSTIF